MNTSKTFRGTVKAQLTMIKGNKAPYFSITNHCGAAHDEILRLYPEYADIVELHLSDIDGTPMYALENGAFYIETFGKDKNYQINTVAKHFRISHTQADCLIRQYNRIENAETSSLSVIAESVGLCGNQVNKYVKPINAKRKFLSEWIESMKPIWKAQADACIKRHGLEIVS